MNIFASNQLYSEISTQALIVFTFDDKHISKEIIVLDQKLDGLISSVIKEDNFKAKNQELLLVNVGKKLNCSKVLLVGLGKRTDFSYLNLQKSIGAAAKFLNKRNVARLAVMLPSISTKRYPIPKIIEAIAKGIILADYQYTEFKTNKTEIPSVLKEVIILSQSKLAEKGIREGRVIAEAINHARDYGNQPSNRATPSYLVEMAHKVATQPRVRCRVLEKKEMEQLKMGAILGVAQGAKHPPKFIILEYKGNPRKKGWSTVLVGKGITFDSGGISIKPSEKMEEMKYDMSGGGAVIGAMEAIAKLKLPVNVVGLVPALENLPSGEAYKPGDVLVSASGKTIEIITTDAEGRVVLADALHYAQRYKPQAIIDIATLTGFCIIALGTHAAGLMGNNPKLSKKVKEAGMISGEKVWELPLWPEYNDQLKSEVADLKNAGGKEAGTINGAAFLAQFINNYPWVHLDIAGTSWSTEEKPYLGKGATGYGVQLFVELMRKP